VCAHGGREVLGPLDCDLVAGEITVMLGASGAGKSTFLRAIAGFEPVLRGSIEGPDGVLSRPGYTLPPERRGVGIVLQSFALFPHLTVRQNVRFAPAARADGFADELLAQVGLDHRSNAYPHELSGGEQQRIALVRALAARPKLILLDEAFSSLDREMRAALRDQTRDLLKRSGVTALAVTHDGEEALSLADRLVLIERGLLVDEGAPERVYWRPRSLAGGRLLGDLHEWEGRVEDHRLVTPFGAFPARGEADGPVSGLIRPAAIRCVPAPDAPVEVVEIRSRGAETRLTLEGLRGARTHAIATGPGELAPKTRVALSLDPNAFSIVRKPA
jgi:iron(III) transport system ATP-binding protein